MKIAIITDTHFGVRGDSPFFKKVQEKFFNDVFIPYLDEHNIKQVIHCGDVFDKRKTIDFSTLQFARTNFFEPLKKREISTDIIIGNHDDYFKTTNDLNSPELLLKEYDVRIFKDPTEVTHGNLKLAYIPWITPENRNDAVKLIQNSSANFLFGHVEVAGFTTTAGVSFKGGFDRSVFALYDFVGFGHFHFRSTGGNITYLGNPWQTTWGDYGSEKGFSVLDTNTREVTFIKNPAEVYKQIFYQDGLEPDNVEDQIVRVIIKDKIDESAFEKYMTKLEESRPFRLETVDKRDVMGNIENVEVDDEIIDDTRSIISASIKEMNTDDDQLKDFFDELYTEAMMVQ